MSKYTKATLEKMETVFQTLEYKVRYEKGNFKSGYCLVEDRKMVVINKFFDLEGRINTMLDILTTMDLENSKLDITQQAFLQRLFTKNLVNQP